MWGMGTDLTPGARQGESEREREREVQDTKIHKRTFNITVKKRNRATYHFPRRECYATRRKWQSPFLYIHVLGDTPNLKRFCRRLENLLTA